MRECALLNVIAALCRRFSFFDIIQTSYLLYFKGWDNINFRNTSTNGLKAQGLQPLGLKRCSLVTRIYQSETY